MGNKKEDNSPLILTVFFILLFLLWVIIITKGQLDSPPVRWSSDGDESESEPCCNGKTTDFNIISSGSKHKNEENQSAANDKLDELERRQTFRRTDLAAQRGMWRATNSLVYLTVFQVFIGFFSALLIFATLREAKKTTEAAIRTVKAAEYAERAHVFVDVGFKVRGLYGPPDEKQLVDISEIPAKKRRLEDIKVEPAISIANYGRTPAMDVEGYIYLVNNGTRNSACGRDRVIPGYYGEYPETRKRVRQKIFKVTDKPINVPVSDTQNTVSDYFRADDKIDDVVFIVIVAVSYKTIFDEPDAKPTVIEHVVEGRLVVNDLGLIRMKDLGGSEFKLNDFKDRIHGARADIRSRRCSDYDENNQYIGPR